MNQMLQRPKSIAMEPATTYQPKARLTGAPPPDFASRFDTQTLDAADPDMWLTLYLDRSIPIDDNAKAAILTSHQRFSRRLLLGVVRPASRIVLGLAAVFRSIVPNRLNAPKALHRLLARALGRWVAPEANYLILRHFHIGSEILQFIKDNVPVEIETTPLRPRRVDDLADLMFMEHDLNLYRVVGQLNATLRESGAALRPQGPLDFSAITDGDFDIAPPPDRWSNGIDLQTAVEAYTPTYQIFLRDEDFWRASTSLQLDETIAVTVAHLIGDDRHVALCQNSHPLLPLPTMGAGWRLMLHGLAAEQLHYRLRLLKRSAAQ